MLVVFCLRKTLAEEGVQIRKDTLTISFRGGLQWNGNEEGQDEMFAQSGSARALHKLLGLRLTIS